jgi:hypothetical protein
MMLPQPFPEIRAMGWPTKYLQRGDITHLRKIARNAAPEGDRIERLERRGFVRRTKDGRFAVTWRGRLAAMLRSFRL